MADMQFANSDEFNKFLGMRTQAGIPTPTELGDAGLKAAKQAAGANSAAASTIKSGMAQRDMLMKNLPVAPASPSLQTRMPTPPQSDFRSPTEALSSLGSVVAIFGSLLTRNPMKTALNAASASMQAFHQGDKEVYERQRQKWLDNMDQALQQNKSEVDEYKLAMDKHRDDMDRAIAEMQAIALKNKDAQTLAALQAPGGAAAVFESLKVREEAGDKLMKEFDQHLKSSRVAVSQQVTLTDDAIDKYADAVAGGVKISALGLGYGNNANKTAVLNHLADKYPDVNLAEVELGYGGQQQEARTVGAAAGRLKLAANSLDQAIPLARQALTTIDLSSYPDLNTLENAARRRTGDPNIARLNTALQTVMSDYSSLIARNGQTTDSTRAAARELINTSMAKGQLEAVFDQMDSEKEAQLRAIQETRSPGSAPKPVRLKKTIEGVTYEQDENGDWYPQ